MLSTIRRIITLVLIVVPISVWPAQAPQNFLREADFRGAELQGQVYLCKSDRVASAGFRRDPLTGTVKEIYEVSAQKNMTTWRITVKERQAEVAALTGATQTLEATQLFSVTRGTALCG